MAFFLSVKIEGQEMFPLTRRVEVEEHDSQADFATIHFGDSNLILADILHEGLAVEIDLGQPDEHALVFRGQITGLRCFYPAKGTPLVSIEAGDSSIAMSLQFRTKQWVDSTVADIVQSIAAANGLRPGKVESPDTDTSAPRNQVDETDLGFLHRLAKEYDCKVFVDAGDSADTLNFVESATLLSADPLDTPLTFQQNLREFSAEFEAFAASPKVTLATTDPLSGEDVAIEKDLVQPSKAAWIPDPARIARLGDSAAAVTQLIAQTAAKRATLTDFWRVPQRVAGAGASKAADEGGALGDGARLLGQKGRGRAYGSVYLRPRRNVKIEGYGGRWSDNWYLSRVRHELDVDQGQYMTDFVCTR